VIALLLLYPKESVNYAKEGLLIWFETMLPTLMPFMILSTLMISLHLTDFPGAKLYCIVMGFLCGFPMGAKVVKDLYIKKVLTRQEANDLLGFCNNLGPIFILNYALPTLGIRKPLPCLIGFYAIPFLYGIIIMRIHRRKDISSVQNKTQSENQNNNISASASPILYHIDDAIQCAIHSITILGGYMIFFNLLGIIPYALQNLSIFKLRNINLLSPVRCILEITGGLSYLGNPTIWILCMIPMGGLSCLAQVFSVIKDTDLSFKTYLGHKMIQTVIISLFFFLISICGYSFG